MADTYIRYVAGVKEKKQKQRLTFAPFSMGMNKNNVSLMFEEALWARATVWIHMHNKWRKARQI